jgi:dTDP-4-dehydrorhamnose reductase
LAWVTGAGGLIGHYLVQAAADYAKQWQVRALTRRDADLLDTPSVKRLFLAERPALIFHCAAITFPPACERDPDLARRTNVRMTADLTELASDIPFVFFSTDLVFNGRQGNYTENDAVHPLTVYAQTKVEAERIVLSNPRHTVIRTSLNGGTSPSGTRGFNEQLREAFSRGETLRLFTDEFRSPIAASITARVAWALATGDHTGLYHVAGAERLSRWEIGNLIATRWPRLQPKIEAMSISDFQGPPRAPDTSLNCAKAAALLSFPLPRFSDWLASHSDIPF